MFAQIPFIFLLPANLLLAVFLGAFFFGDSVIITLSYVAAQRGWSVWHVFLGAFAGTLISDIMWYYFGRRLARKKHAWNTYFSRHRHLTRVAKQLAPKDPFLALLYIKFLYGSHILTMLYISWKNIPLKSFILYDIAGICIWLAAIIGIGWFAGREYMIFEQVAGSFEYVATTLLLVLVITKLLSLWITKRFASG
jgi:membrane protein DedA with SNARE-associated domain